MAQSQGPCFLVMHHVFRQSQCAIEVNLAIAANSEWQQSDDSGLPGAPGISKLVMDADCRWGEGGRAFLGGEEEDWEGNGCKVVRKNGSGKNGACHILTPFFSLGNAPPKKEVH